MVPNAAVMPQRCSSPNSTAAQVPSKVFKKVPQQGADPSVRIAHAPVSELDAVDNDTKSLPAGTGAGWAPHEVREPASVNPVQESQEHLICRNGPGCGAISARLP